MNNPPTLEDVQSTYSEVFDRSCVEPQYILDGYVRFRDTWDKIDTSDFKYISPCDTLEDYVKSMKTQEGEKEHQREYQQKLSQLKGNERFLFMEGFTEDWNKTLQDAIENTPEGKEVFESVLQVFSRHDSQDKEQQVLEFACKHLDECKEEFLPNFLYSKAGKDLMGWFQGITLDGGRSLRTIHICVKVFREYCKEQWKFAYATRKPE